MQQHGAWLTNQRRMIGLGLIVIGIGVLVVGIGVALPALMILNSEIGAAGSLTILLNLVPGLGVALVGLGLVTIGLGLRSG